MKNSNLIVEKIHAEFDSAQDKLLRQAREVILESRLIEGQADKASRLKNLGFTNALEVKTFEAIDRNLVMSREQAQLIEYYKNNYVFQKFMVESQLDEICKKYGLMYAPVSNYTGSIPDKNLKEIEDAKPLSSQDIRKTEWYVSVTEFYDDTSENLKRYLSKPFKYSPSKDEKSRGYPYQHIFAKAIIDSGYEGELPWFIFHKSKLIKVDKSGLFIAAPPSYFDLKGLKKKSEFGFFKVIEREIKDPIVFRYCRGGLQVLSKWGLEGEDELLINEKLN